jgi:hypothetical protein
MKEARNSLRFLGWHRVCVAKIFARIRIANEIHRGQRKMNMWLKASVAAAGMILLMGQAHANTILNFEDGEYPGLVAMGNSPGSPVPISAQLSNQFLSIFGASFSSNSAFVAVVNHSPTLTPSPPNVIGGTSDGALNYNSPIFVTFFLPSDTSMLATTDFVQVLGDLFPLNSGTATLTAFDAVGNQIGSTTAADAGAPGTGLTLSLSLVGIHSVEITETSATVGFDNFEFGNLTAVPTDVSVPEPLTLSIFGAGVAGAVALRRRKKI